MIGLSLIDKMLAGLPENSRLRIELAELRSLVAKLETEKQNLESQLKDARSEIGEFKQNKQNSENLLPEELRILKFLSNSRDYTLAADMEVGLNIDGGMADYLLGRLRDAKYIYQNGQTPPRFKIEQKGMEAIF